MVTMSASAVSAFLAGMLMLVVLPECWSQKETGDEQYSPILLVSGLMANQLQIKNTRLSVCNTLGGYRDLWINTIRLPVCVDDLRLIFDPAEKRFHNKNGVYVKPKEDLPGIEYLDSNKEIPLLKPFVDYYVNNLGYKRGKSIRGSTYDWRRGANEIKKSTGFFPRTKYIIEDMYTKNGNRSLTLVCFSMGCPVTHHLLTRTGLTQEWKDKHIHAYVTVVGAWAGGVHFLQAVSSGTAADTLLGKLENLGSSIKNVLGTYLSYLERSFEGLYWLMPRTPIWNDEVLVSTPSGDYTAKQYEQMFKDFGKGFEHSYAKFTTAISTGADFPAPNVRTYCLYSLGVDTPEHLEYTKAEIRGQTPIITMGDGDGVINAKNAEVCLQWKNMKNHKFVSYVCRGLQHNNICGTDLYPYIGKIVKIPQSETNSEMNKKKMKFDESVALLEAIEEKFRSSEVTVQEEIVHILEKLID